MSISGELARSDLISNYRAVTLVKAERLSTTSAVVACEGFSAQMLDEAGTETEVPALDHVVFIQVLSRRPTVWTDLMGRRSCVDAPARSFVHVPAGLASWWHVRNCGGAMLHTVFEPGFLAALAEDEKLSADMKPCVGRPNHTLALLTALLVEEIDRRVESKLYLETLARAIGIGLLRFGNEAAGPTARRGGLPQHLLKRTTEFLLAHLAEEVSLVDLAAIADLSPYHFARAFKQSAGLPPHAWLTARRVERAQEMMLAHKEMGLTEIALSVGYSTQAAFGVAFRRVTGVTPGQWRRERAG